MDLKFGLNALEKLKKSGKTAEFAEEMGVNSTWEQWKTNLGKAVEFAEELGISKERVSGMAMQIGHILADNVNPKIPEQKLLKELWQAADEKQQEVLADLMVKIADQSRQSK